MIEGYFQALEGNSFELVRRAFLSCIKQHERAFSPKTGEVLAEIARLQAEANRVKRFAEEQQLRLTSGPVAEESEERRARLVEVYRPLLDLVGTNPTEHARKAAYDKVTNNLTLVTGTEIDEQ